MAAVIMAVLFMGLLGLFVLVPIAVIHVAWNSLVSPISHLPNISVWQAVLLYFMLATLAYLTGFLEINVEAREID